MKKVIVLLLSLLMSFSAFCQDYLSKYSNYERQAEYNVTLSTYWRSNVGGNSKGITGKFIVSYSGLSKIVILFFKFKDTQQEMEYRMSVMDETQMTRMEDMPNFQLRQFKVQNIDNPYETALVVLEKNKAGEYHVYVFQQPGKTPAFFPFNMAGWSDNEKKTNCIFQVGQ